MLLNRVEEFDRQCLQPNAGLGDLASLNRVGHGRVGRPFGGFIVTTLGFFGSSGAFVSAEQVKVIHKEAHDWLSTWIIVTGEDGYEGSNWSLWTKRDQKPVLLSVGLYLLEHSIGDGFRESAIMKRRLENLGNKKRITECYMTEVKVVTRQVGE